jgi:surfactin synthase thioesterase subunit
MDKFDNYNAVLRLWRMAEPDAAGLAYFQHAEDHAMGLTSELQDFALGMYSALLESGVQNFDRFDVTPLLRLFGESLGTILAFQEIARSARAAKACRKS